MISRLQNYLRDTTGEVFLLEVTSDERFGDYASNVAFRLAKERKCAPLVVAQELAELVRAKDAEHVFERVEVAGGGFVNFWVSPRVFLDELEDIMADCKLRIADRSGVSKKINLEFISANPTGPLTMANGRGGFLGDALSNVLESVGHKVTREYYINDAGVQIQRLGESVCAVLGLISKNEEQYQGGYVALLAERLAQSAKRLYEAKGSTAFEPIGRRAATLLLARIKKSVKNVGIKFDVWFSEQKTLRKTKALQSVLCILRERDQVFDRDGAVWLRSTDGSDDKDRVLVKSTGEPTYFLADMAYHYNKFLIRKFDLGINIWGADHHGYVARLKSGIASLGVSEDRLKIILIQLVRLVRGGEEVRMSKRRGEFITLDELVAEVGVDSARFFFLLYATDTHMDFDLDLAKERSMKNPVYYVQYAFVRCNSILQIANPACGQVAKIQIKDTKIFSIPPMRRLIKVLVQFPDLVLQTATDYQVHRLARYAMDMARAFHHFYELERVITDDAAATAERLQLVLATKNIFEKLFALLGISAPKKM